ncbi:MAG: ABC transporter substrate-binding protein/permease [Clostridia bacterium]|nr:ABC transporter substrate-binding protein/permease [Clostridia bacterium]
MNLKKKLKFLILIIICIFSFGKFNSIKIYSLSEISKRNILKVSTNAEFEPFEFHDGDKITGIDIEIAEKITEKLSEKLNKKIKLEINDVSFDALTLEISNHTCDFAISAMSYSDDKSHGVDFSIPYYIASQSILVLNSSDIKNHEDLHNKNIGVQIGTTGDLYCTQNFKDSRIERYNQISDAVTDLENKRIDVIIVDDLPARNLARILNNKAKVLEDSLFEESYRIVVPEGRKELLEFINNIIEELDNSGELKHITDKYITVSASSDRSLKARIHRSLFEKDRYKIILTGLYNTLRITIVALLIGLIIGTLISVINTSESNNIFTKILKFIAKIYLVIIRGTPATAQLFVTHFIIFASSGLNKITIAMIAFGINSGAYVSEIIRSGIISVDVGQYEAARSLGLSRKITMIKIIVPQAIKIVLPTLINELIQLVKETSVAGFIGVTDLSRAGDIIRSSTYEPTVPLITISVIYLIIVSIFGSVFSRLEKRLRKSAKN